MRIITRYIAVQFFKPFLYGMGLFSLLIFLADFFDHLNMLLRSQAPFHIIFQYEWLRVPFWAVQVIPVATLLATLISLGRLIRMGEWMAMEISGFHPRQLFKPLLLCSLGIVAFSFAAQEIILPACTRKLDRLYQQYIYKGPVRTHWEDVVLGAGPGKFLTAHVFDSHLGRMERVVADFYVDDTLARELDAIRAVWDGGRGIWIFERGVLRVFGEDNSVIEKPFQELISDITISPQNLIPEEKDPEGMSMRELLQHIRKLKRLGFSQRKEWVVFYKKLAYPFSNVLLCILGIPFAIKLRGGSRALNFGCAVGVAFLYWWLTSVGQAIGESGGLPPFVSSWIPNILFGLVGIYFLLRL
ncbi:MAG: LptF/LptG family permease [Elusimicrobia bacterium]|nr:LptF/LptG family permease [Elusimicrobiota bacterium]